MSRTFGQRILLLAVLFSSELIIFSVWLFHTTQPIDTKHDWAAFILRCIVGFAVVFIPWAYLKNQTALTGIYNQTERTPIRWSFFAAHCFAMIVAVKLSSLIYLAGGLRRADLLTAGWFVAGISAIAFAGFTFLPGRIWAQLVRGTGYLWAYTSIAIVSAIAVGPYFRRWLWGPTIQLTFRLTKIFLTPFVSGIVTDPARMVIGTPNFRVQILSGCSGLEGIGLVLAFVTLWLFVFRKEFHFPRSLVLIPLGVVLIFLLNAMRIAALVLIGNAGARQIAVNGFHSQAGWIAFSIVSAGFCFVIQRVPWFSSVEQHGRDSLGTATHNPTAAFLTPLVMILAAGMIAGAATGADKFEWLYPLRFFAAAGALWIFRRSYASMNWKFDWMAPAIGAAVFVIWIALDRSANAATADSGVSTALMGLSPVAKTIWIAFRVLAAVVTVPLAEELAFRGFLMRRFVSADFESVSFRSFTSFALLASSIIFGFLHGGFWIAGCIAGVLFGWAVIRRGRIGDAVVAHATANAFLAAYVLAYHKWHLW